MARARRSRRPAQRTRPPGRGRQVAASRRAGPRRAVLVAVAAVLAVGGIALGARLLTRSDSESRPPASATSLTDAQLGRIAEAVAAELRGATARDASLGVLMGPAYVTLRDGGEAAGTGWSAEGDDADVEVLDSIRSAIAAARRDGDADPAEVDVAEIAVSHGYRPVALADPLPPVLTNAHRGVRGLELRRGAEVVRYSPTWMLATNRGFERVLERYAEERGIDDVTTAGSGVRARVFEAEQFLVFLDGRTGRARRMVRGNEVVGVDDVTASSVARTARRLGDWLAGAVHADGRMTYQWLPSRGEESGGDNTVRQWMATAALGRYAAWRGDEKLRELTRRNIAYNLRTYYTEELGLGLIEEGPEKVKLGAVALAGRALAEQPGRERLAPVIDALERTTQHLANPDGSFRTWFRPAGRDDQHNFYPGEALYFWAHRYAERRDPETLERLLRAFRYYRRWHLDPANRNPAFVPWHTQAAVEVWRHAKSGELAAFVFEMNDWLLAMQQWDDVAYPDLRGRFYDPDHPEYGPPHASSTGVYLEGLADAFWLARELGKPERAERYRRAIVRGIRGVMQLEFADEVDLYYVSDRERVVGGVRTEVYDNRIRVDNVQHNLMALLKVLERFSPADYRP